MSRKKTEHLASKGDQNFGRKVEGVKNRKKRISSIWDQQNKKMKIFIKKLIRERNLNGIVGGRSQNYFAIERYPYGWRRKVYTAAVQFALSYGLEVSKRHEAELDAAEI